MTQVSSVSPRIANLSRRWRQGRSWNALSGEVGLVAVCDGGINLSRDMKSEINQRWKPVAAVPSCALVELGAGQHAIEIPKYKNYEVLFWNHRNIRQLDKNFQPVIQ
ncbi:hypothetical protein RRG08_041981 [Elysia crispata]|uniref:Uncharacterized protein n=1 Tax=Elysia crispata TaxID=231223 RepID=A0AAE1D812_9GAST|nr:hypothetical protein RRG08_041981 [Elysia crispata]